jgi:hypothetical protein
MNLRRENSKKSDSMTSSSWPSSSSSSSGSESFELGDCCYDVEEITEKMVAIYKRYLKPYAPQKLLKLDLEEKSKLEKIQRNPKRYSIDQAIFDGAFISCTKVLSKALSLYDDTREATE